MGEKEREGGKGVMYLVVRRFRNTSHPSPRFVFFLISLFSFCFASFFSFWFFPLLFLLASYAKTSRSHDSVLRCPPSAALAVYLTTR
jgi:hypothetical protein